MDSYGVNLSYPSITRFLTGFGATRTQPNSEHDGLRRNRIASSPVLASIALFMTLGTKDSSSPESYNSLG